MSAPLITISLTLPENMLTSVYALLSGGSSVPGNLPAIAPALGNVGSVTPATPSASATAPSSTSEPAAGISSPAATSTTAQASASPSDSAELDAAGVAWDPERHASTKSKTSAGLWRMRVGVSRPEHEGVPATGNSGTGTSAATPSSTATASGVNGTVSAPQSATVDEDDEFAAFRTATATPSAPAVRNWSDGDLSKLCNQAAMKAGGPEGVKAIIAKFVPEGQLAHSRSIPAEQRENFAKEVETTFGIAYEG